MEEENLYIRCNRQFCEQLTEAIELFDDYHRKTSLPLLQVLSGYQGLLQKIEEATKFFDHGDQGLTTVCKRIYEYCVLLILDRSWSKGPQDDLAYAASKFYAYHCSLCPWSQNSFLVVATLAQNPWRGKTMSAILSATDIIQEEQVTEFLSMEGHFILEHRLRILIEDGSLNRALNLSQACVNHPELGQVPIFLETMCLLLHKLGRKDTIKDQVAKESSLDHLARVIQNMREYCPEVASLLAGMALQQAWAGSNAALTRTITRLWLDCTWEHCASDAQAFATELDHIYRHTKDPIYLFCLADMVYKKIGDAATTVLVSLCLHALTNPSVPLSQDFFLAASIDSGNVAICCLLYQLLEGDFRLQRLCILTVFFIAPSIKIYNILKDIFNRKVTYVNLPKLNSYMQHDLVQCIKYFMPEEISPALEWSEVSKVCCRYLHKSKVFRTEWRLPNGCSHCIRVHIKSWDIGGEPCKLLRIQELKAVCFQALERCRRGTELVSIVREHQRLPESEHQRKPCKRKVSATLWEECSSLQTMEPCTVTSVKEDDCEQENEVQSSSKELTYEESLVKASKRDVHGLSVVLQDISSIERNNTVASTDDFNSDEDTEVEDNELTMEDIAEKTTLEKMGSGCSSFTKCSSQESEMQAEQVLLENSQKELNELSCVDEELHNCAGNRAVADIVEKDKLLTNDTSFLSETCNQVKSRINGRRHDVEAYVALETDTHVSPETFEKNRYLAGMMQDKRTTVDDFNNNGKRHLHKLVSNNTVELHHDDAPSESGNCSKLSGCLSGESSETQECNANAKQDDLDREVSAMQETCNKQCGQVIMEGAQEGNKAHEIPSEVESTLCSNEKGEADKVLGQCDCSGCDLQSPAMRSSNGDSQVDVALTNKANIKRTGGEMPKEKLKQNSKPQQDKSSRDSRNKVEDHDDVIKVCSPSVVRSELKDQVSEVENNVEMIPIQYFNPKPHQDKEIKVVMINQLAKPKPPEDKEIQIRNNDQTSDTSKASLESEMDKIGRAVVEVCSSLFPDSKVRDILVTKVEEPEVFEESLPEVVCIPMKHENHEGNDDVETTDDVLPETDLEEVVDLKMEEAKSYRSNGFDEVAACGKQPEGNLVELKSEDVDVCAKKLHSQCKFEAEQMDDKNSVSDMTCEIDGFSVMSAEVDIVSSEGRIQAGQPLKSVEKDIGFCLTAEKECDPEENGSSEELGMDSEDSEEDDIVLIEETIPMALPLESVAKDIGINIKAENICDPEENLCSEELGMDSGDEEEEYDVVLIEETIQMTPPLKSGEKEIQINIKAEKECNPEENGSSREIGRDLVDVKGQVETSSRAVEDVQPSTQEDSPREDVRRQAETSCTFVDDQASTQVDSPREDVDSLNNLTTSEPTITNGKQEKPIPIDPSNAVESTLSGIEESCEVKSAKESCENKSEKESWCSSGKGTKKRNRTAADRGTSGSVSKEQA